MLDALSPLKVLDRGYSITQIMPTMKVVKNSGQLKKDDELMIKFLKGSAKCKVDTTEVN